MLYFIVGKEPNEQEFPWHVGGNIPRLGKVDKIYADGHELQHLQRLGFAIESEIDVTIVGDRANSALRALRLHAQSKTETPAVPIGLGDVVSFNWNDAYHHATVTQVHKDGTVDLLRPYVHTSDVSYSGRHKDSSSVLSYLGFEEVKDIKPERLTLVRKAPVPR
jgi:hypothetical protein